MKLLTSSENTLSSLEKLNITTSEELLDYLPYKYEDNSYSDLTMLEDKQKITVLGKLVSSPRHFSNGKIDIIDFFFSTNDRHFFKVKVFNRPYLMKDLKLGEEFSLSGTYSADNKEINLINFFKGVIPGEKKIRSVYHLPQALSQANYRKLVERTYEAMSETIIDPLPSFIREKYRLASKAQALKMVHFPSSEDDVNKGLRTLKFHECMAYCMKNQIIRGENKRLSKTPKGVIDTKKINEFVKNLSYKLTSDQISAVRDVILDMNKPALMYRLLQGDVGTGKTIVSTIALYGNYIRGKIGAFMVPTDSLARQQYISLKRDLEPYGIRIGLLIGGLPLKEKQSVKTALRNGEIDVICGTHALFSEDVEYPSLGLVIIDEQHRFGVNQRNELLSKDEGSDLLLMSATPIPRTLAISIYGDMDITTLKEFPNKERDVETEICSPKSPLVISTVRDCLNENRNVFIVAPKITLKDEDKVESAEQIYEMYHALFRDQVRILHGRMSSEEKNTILGDFIAKKFLILVSTTVIELGINVMDSGAIIIYSASRFGLASLHQLRGRVGRDGKKAVCLLVDEEDNERLNVLKENNDGFVIAEKDMQMRGPGDATGTMQSGFPTFSCLNIVDDFRMFECARDDVTFILSHQYNNECKYYYFYVQKEIESKKDITLFD